MLTNLRLHSKQRNATLPQYNLRDAGTLSSGTEFLVAAFDSTLPSLKSIGGGEMRGEVPFSEKIGFWKRQKYRSSSPRLT